PMATVALSPASLAHPPPPALYPLSLHDALPIWQDERAPPGIPIFPPVGGGRKPATAPPPAEIASRLPPFECLADRPVGGIERAVDRKSTRLNSSHVKISYAVFCLKKKK